MRELRLTHAAATDLVDIATYGIERFGPVAARQYFDNLICQLTNIATTPGRFPDVRHIRPGYRRCVYGVHSIYFRHTGEIVAIVRILGRQSPDQLR